MQQDGFCLELDSSSGLISMSSWLSDLGRVSCLSGQFRLECWGCPVIFLIFEQLAQGPAYPGTNYSQK